MLTDSQKKFVEDILASQIVSAEEFKAWGADAKGTSDAQSFANNLVRSGKLTPWQAKYLLGGRTRLRFGNYILTDRLDRDDLGDAFVGKHDKLDRNVRLLFLATEHSKTLAANEQLIRELASTTDVDHPNLEQVHLIDQDTGRYMFVTQQLNGKKLSDPELLTRLVADQIPGMLKQIIAALTTAHEAGLCHGNLSEENVYVTENQNVKIEGFLRSNLRSNLIENKTPTVDVDVTALNLMAKKLVKRFDSQEARLIVADLERVGDGQMSLSAIAGREYGGKKTLPAVDTSTPKTSDRVAGQPKQAAAKKVPLTGKDAEKTKSNLSRNLMWATTAVLAVATLIIVGPKLLGSKSEDAQAKTGSAAESIELPTLSDSLKTSSPTEPQSDELPDRIENKGSGTIDDDNGLVDINVTLQTDDDVDNEDHYIEVSSDSAYESEAAPQGDEPKPGTGSSSGSSLLDKFKASTEDEYDSAASGKESTKPVAKKNTEDQDDEQAKPSKPKEAPVSATSTTFPTSVDLPPNTITDGLGLVNFGEHPITALGLELLSDENVSLKSKIEFELSGERNRSWDVSLIDSQATTKVGRFAWENNQLNFNWYPGVADNTEANYLGNCILKINDGSETRFLPLRKPVIISGFVLQRNDPRLKVEIDNLEYLPKGCIAELHELDSEKYGQVYFGESVEDQTFSRKQPLRFTFSEIPEYQMVMMTLNAEIKNKSKLEALLQIQLSPEQKPRLANEKTMESAKQFLEQYIVDVTSNYETLKKMKVDELRKKLNMTKEQLPYEDKKAREKQLKEEIEIAKKRAEVFRETQSQLEPFFSQPIPISIYYQQGDQRVVLATTVSGGG